MTGSICGGWQCGKFGRKKSLMFDCFFFIIGILMSAFAPNFYVLLASRILLGHSSCSSMVSTPIYTSEISQPMIRKITGSFTIICYTTGYALAVILGIYTYKSIFKGKLKYLTIFHILDILAWSKL